MYYYHFGKAMRKRRLTVTCAKFVMILQKFVVVEPQTLFTPPVNRGLKRMNIEERMTQENGLVFGKVMVRWVNHTLALGCLENRFGKVKEQHTFLRDYPGQIG